jgi:hypothetical protein
MILRKVLSIFFVCSFSFLAAVLSFTYAVFGQDLSKTVLPVTQTRLKLKLKKSIPSSANPVALKPKISLGADIDFGTGFCLDPECRLIGTTYHVAATTHPRKIRGA